ncbi:MAG: dihydrodipicolinate synthase family protein [Gordonia sp. (in: high G+C Gram-positive bacteria)]
MRLPAADGALAAYEPGPAREWARPVARITSRIAYAAAHVVPRVTGANVPGAPAEIDWDATLGYRHRIWEYGLGVAEAMDTAQRGMGVGWEQAAELIRRCAAEARSVGGRIAAGAGTDQLDLTTLPQGAAGLRAVTDAYRRQIEVVAGAGAKVIVMASRALAQVARSADDYAQVYGSLLQEAHEPVILHWLGTVFDPSLAGYWGSDDIDRATGTFRDVIGAHAAAVDGVKVSLLDATHEIALRRALPAGVKLYTGDDFNYPELITGDAQGFSHALLGIFAAIYPTASVALQALDAGEPSQARQLLDGTRELGRLIFEAPTYHYKTGIAFLSWLNGFQPGFTMVGGLHGARSVVHLSQVFQLADQAGLLVDPDGAARRMRAYLITAGVPQ